MFKGFENFRIALIIVIVSSVLVPLFIYLAKKEVSLQCDYVIFIKGETSRDARYVYFSSTGIATIEYCDGSQEQIPTHRILRVINK
jgi:uncharacterized protein (UPF0248 family)